MAVISNMRFDARVHREAHALAAAGHRVRVVSITDGDQLERYTTDGFEIVAVPYRIGSYAGLVRFYRQLAREVAAEPTDAYHAHNVNTLATVLRVAKRAGKPVIYDSHELFFGLLDAPRFRPAWFKQRAERWAERRYIRHAQGYITVSRSYAQQIAKYYRIDEPVVLQNCPPLLPELKPTGELRRRIGVDPATPLVLYQGGYYLDTRPLDNLVRAMRFLPERVHLVFIGFGVRDEESTLRQLVEHEGLGNRVHFHPAVKHQELVQLTADADVGVIPFYDNCPAMHWSTPNKLYEYLMAGLPIISTDLPEIRRVLDETGAGFVFDPTDPKSVAEAIQRAVKDPAKLERMRVHARAAAETRYNWEAEAPKLIGLYRRILAKRD